MPDFRLRPVAQPSRRIKLYCTFLAIDKAFYDYRSCHRPSLSDLMNYLLALTLGACAAHGAWAQSLCASDGRATPTRLVERFVSADCEACWRAPQMPRTDRQALTIDWIVPTDQGDDAALSAAATPDARIRLDTLGHAAPATSSITATRVERSRANQLRVAHGSTVGAYIGAIIELRTTVKVRPEQPLSAWLILVETIPAGSDGTPVERNLVRNVLVSTWGAPDHRSQAGPYLFRELRPMNVPQGAKPERLRLVGWVQNAQGRVLSAARSVCATSRDPG